MNSIKEKFFAFKDRLVRTGGQEPLSKLSLAVILILDIFVLVMIFEGLGEHTRQLTSPDEQVPFECRQAFIDKDWTRADFLDRLQRLVLSDYNNKSFRRDSLLERRDTGVMHETCRQFYSLIKQVARDERLAALFVDRQDLLKERNRLAARLKKSKAAYDTALLEEIARKNGEEKSLSGLKASIHSSTRGMEEISGKLILTEQQLEASPLIIQLKEMVGPSREYRQELKDAFKRFQFLYPFKELGWQLVFMLPIFLVFYFWSSRSVKKDNGIQILISSHLLVVAALPIVLKAGEVVIDLIPRHFFKDLFKILKSLHIIALWHYIVIAFCVGAGLLAVYIIQKKLFNRKRIQQKRLMKGACYFCGKTLPDRAGRCPFCGTNQLKNCSQCQEETYVCGDYCKHCGYKT